MQWTASVRQKDCFALATLFGLEAELRLPPTKVFMPWSGKIQGPMSIKCTMHHSTRVACCATRAQQSVYQSHQSRSLKRSIYTPVSLRRQCCAPSQAITTTRAVSPYSLPSFPLHPWILSATPGAPQRISQRSARLLPNHHFSPCLCTAESQQCIEMRLRQSTRLTAGLGPEGTWLGFPTQHLPSASTVVFRYRRERLVSEPGSV